MTTTTRPALEPVRDRAADRVVEPSRLRNGENVTISVSIFDEHAGKHEIVRWHTRIDGRSVGERFPVVFDARTHHAWDALTGALRGDQQDMALSIDPDPGRCITVIAAGLMRGHHKLTPAPIPTEFSE